MKRRTTLSLGLAGLAGLAGCGGSGGPETGAETGTESTTSTPTPAGADGLSIVEFATPETVPVRRQYPVGLRVENPTETGRRFESGVSIRIDGEWRALDATLGGTVGPEEAATFGARLPGLPFLGTYELRLDATGRTTSVEVMPVELSFGDPFQTPDGLRVAVQGGRFESTYTGGGNNTTARTPPPDSQWVVVRVQIRNPSGESTGFPPYGAFVLVVGGERYTPALAGADDPVTVPSSQRSVGLPYVVPADATADGLSVRWEPTYGGRRTGAVWSSA